MPIGGGLLIILSLGYVFVGIRDIVRKNDLDNIRAVLWIIILIFLPIIGILLYLMLSRPISRYSLKIAVFYLMSILSFTFLPFLPLLYAGIPSVVIVLVIIATVAIYFVGLYSFAKIH